MAALAAPPPISSGMSRAPAGPPRDERPTSFTAVNGSYRRGSHSEAHVIGDTITVATDKQPPYHQAHDHSRPTPPPSRQENLYMDFRNGTIDQQQLPSPTETSVNSAKRKRSISEDEVSPSMPPAQRPHMRHGHQHSFDDQHFHQQSNHRSREVHSDGEQALNEERTRQRSGDTSRTSPSSGRPDSYLTEQQQYAEPLSSETDRPSRGFPPSNNAPQWEQPPSYPQGYHDENEQTGTENTGRPPSSQRSSEHQGSHGSWAFTHSHQDSNEPEDSSYQDNGQPQANPKRKRNFSNRTKTGCMTCRKRKKKCDEAHPFCQNCSRGGFTCEGYSSRASWPKTNNPKTPVPLQSKDDQDNAFVPGGQSPARPAGPQLPSMAASNPFPPRPGTQEALEGTRGYAPSPASATSTIQPQYPSTWPGANQNPYNAERRPDFRDLPPLQHPNRTESQREYAGVPPISEISRAPPGHANQAPATPWTGTSPSDGRLPYTAPSAPPSSAAPPSGQSAHPAEGRAESSRRPPAGTFHDSKVPSDATKLIPMSERAEKDKMIKGHLFKFTDPRLQDERSRCREALWRLNNAATPMFGMSEDEKRRLLESMLKGTKLHDKDYIGPAPMERPEGSIAAHAYVELPFKCHYGYNIHIGENAYIGENCTIIDACKVTIGAKTWIGSNVTILTGMAHTDLQHRQGADSSWQGKEVIIEEDVYIGANVMIYPGVKLSRGAFIEPGSIVKQDQPQYGYLGYKPMYLSQSTPAV